MRHGVLLINLGTPKSTAITAVGSYLCAFLTDKRVINLPTVLRYLLVYGLILPFRTKNSAHAYQEIWTEQGSPLLIHSQNMANRLQEQLGKEYQVVLGMRYGEPSIAKALNELKNCASITVLPLYPQYSSAATGSSIEEVMRLISRQEVIPSLKIIREFYQHPAYIKAQAQRITFNPDPNAHLLFSYHGIPENQIRKSGCLKHCEEHCPNPTEQNESCYKAQCYQTSRLLAAELKVHPTQYSTAFQSRLGKTPWIKPYTDEMITELAAKGIKKLTIVCPSFIADCLETLEEIGMRAQEQWLKLGGEEIIITPCMNDTPEWIQALATLIT